MIQLACKTLILPYRPPIAPSPAYMQYQQIAVFFACVDLWCPTNLQKSLKNGSEKMPKNELPYGRSFYHSKKPASNMSNTQPLSSICKPYIFHRAELVNTEIIITATFKPLIFLPDSVVTYGGHYSFPYQIFFFRHSYHKSCPMHYR